MKYVIPSTAQSCTCEGADPPPQRWQSDLQRISQEVIDQQADMIMASYGAPANLRSQILRGANGEVVNALREL